MIDSLPAELIDAIIDHLHDDITSLLRCSQVCKVFVPSSRHHLFSIRIVSFNGRSHSDNNRLVKLLSDKHSTFLLAVRRVSLGKIQSETDLATVLCEVAPCIGALQRSTSLYLRGVTWKNVSNDVQTSFASSFPALSELILSNTKCDTFYDMLNLVAAFPALERLHFARVQWGSGPSATPSSTEAQFFRLRTLEVNYDCPGVLLWLTACAGAFPRLRNLHLKLSEAAYVFPAFAPALQHIEVAYYRLCSDSARDFYVDLTHNHELRSIHFSHLRLDEEEYDWDESQDSPRRRPPYFGWIPRIISSVVSHHIERVQFSMWVSRDLDMQMLDWHELGEALNQWECKGEVLNEVRFDIYGKVYGEDLRVVSENQIRQTLQGCWAVSLVRFVWH